MVPQVQGGDKTLFLHLRDRPPFVTARGQLKLVQLGRLCLQQLFPAVVMVVNQETNRLRGAQEIALLPSLHAHSLSYGKHLLRYMDR